ncbi:MAG: DNA polymerase IV [Myxococcota bacterium]|nr:DNA polymerase IV [Myxococcota bacterium]
MAERESQSERLILHIDMDAFFASVEVLDHPELRGKPVLVGGVSRRGVVAAASYEARRFGVRSAMWMVEALRRCPDAVVVRPRHGRYAEVSAQVFSIFRRFTPEVEGLSLDEAFLDVTGSRKLFGDGLAIASQIKSTILAETGLIASAGVAPSKFVAKIASDLDKPDGLRVVEPEDVVGFLAPLPIERMWGVGKVGAERLHRIGVHTIGDLAAIDGVLLERELGSSAAGFRALAKGIDTREVVVGSPAKSIGAEVTFDADIADREVLEKHLLAKALKVAARLSEKGISGRVVTLKFKYNDFQQKTLRTTLREPVWDGDSIFEAARKLLVGVNLSHKPLRLIGVSVSDLGGAGQAVLFPDLKKKRGEALQRLADSVTDKFGPDLLTRATLLDED